MIDAIDKVAGLSADQELFRARRFRPEFVEGAELCRLSVLRPQDDQGLATELRLAVAHRIATLNADPALVADYAAQLAECHPSEELLALAGGETSLTQPLAALARHCDLITLTPDRAEASDITLLEQAGLDNPQIVALSELIAFINFQTRVAAGLRLMRSV